jgi:hypothetical protein
MIIRDHIGKHRKPSRESSSNLVLTWTLLGLTMLLLSGVGSAGAQYQIQRLAWSGYKTGAISIKGDGHFYIGTLNDSGQVIFAADSANGGQELILYDGGMLTPIQVPQEDAGGVASTQKIEFFRPISMNQRGNAVFSTFKRSKQGLVQPLGTYMWTYQTKMVTPVARKGMTVTTVTEQNGVSTGKTLTITTGGGATPVINNKDDIVLVARVDGEAEDQEGVFHRTPEGILLPVTVLARIMHQCLAGNQSGNDSGTW